MISAAQKQSYNDNGFLLVEALFSPGEVAFLRDHYMKLRAEGARPGDLAGVDSSSDDPLKKFPRMIHMHHWDAISKAWMLDARLNEVMTSLLETEPLAVQTMLYFKPAGARGQALHQDNFYLRVSPGTCMAAWLALDRCDEDNGCMRVVPGSHKWPLLCPTKADTTQSFTDVTVPIPEGQDVRPVIMEPGDVLFFNGSVVHGSYPNTSKDRFRRALIGHYIDGKAETVQRFYDPVLRMDGSRVSIAPSPEGGPCGVWVDKDGQPEVELQGVLAGAGASE